MQKQGTTTAFSISGYEHDDWKHYADQPETEQWKGHRTVPTFEFFAAWTLRYEKLVWFMCPRSMMSAGQSHTRADNRPQEEELCQQDMPIEWIPDYCDAVKEIEELENREWRMRYLKNDAVSVFDIPSVIMQFFVWLIRVQTRTFIIRICDMVGVVEASISRAVKTRWSK
jgi:ribose 5-phosphate isomerase